MKTKKTFRSPIIFLIEAIFFVLIFTFAFLFFGWVSIMSYKDQSYFGFFVGIGFIIMVAVGWKTYIIPTVIPMFFSKLIITDEGVEYRCIFKKLFISWDKCNYCGIQKYKSDIKDLYNTGRVYIYFSEEPIPQGEASVKDMAKNNDKCIKYFPVSKKLCEEVLKHKPTADLRRHLFQKNGKTGWMG